jgi:glycosyltransferase involved in cell wall biosynthesis
MRFSVLLPTRNRLEYLKLAIESVRRQDLDDWQVVVADNCSEQDIEGYLGSLNEPRITYTRTEPAVPVTENWNRALAASTGDYVIMLGDDDALLPGYLRRMDRLIAAFGNPDVIYTKSLLFTYPGVHPAHPDGFLMDYGTAEFFRGHDEPFILDSSTALAVVKGAMNFRLRFDFNAQFALIARSLIASLRGYGEFYQSAFPDYYSMNAAFLRARRIVVDPVAGTIIGVTPKSYGYFHLNDQETEGRNFLDAAKASASTGTNINVGWLSAATALEHGPGGDFGLRANRRRYRLVQAAHVYPRYRAGLVDRAALRRMEQEFPPIERLFYRAGHLAFALFGRLVPTRLKVAIHTRRLGQLPKQKPPVLVEGRYRDSLEVFEAHATSSSANRLRTEPSRG